MKKAEWHFFMRRRSDEKPRGNFICSFELKKKFKQAQFSNFCRNYFAFLDYYEGRYNFK